MEVFENFIEEELIERGETWDDLAESVGQSSGEKLRASLQGNPKLLNLLDDHFSVSRGFLHRLYGRCLGLND